MKASSYEYISLRQALIGRGVSLRQFAAQHGYPASSVYAAARGSRAGVKATTIRRQLQAYLHN